MRKRRLFSPRTGVHITARTQGGVKWFDPGTRDLIAHEIIAASSSFGHWLLGFVVMKNHFHLVIRHGSTPLGWMMQRIMQRAAWRVRQQHGAEGHVFGRRYWSSACMHPGYLRRAIVYAHLNPSEAGLSDKPADYKWSGHAAFTTFSSEPLGSRPLDEGLFLFANNSIDRADAIRNYDAFVNYTIERRRTGIPGDWLLPDGPQRHAIPLAAHGDTHWATHYSSFVENYAEPKAKVDVGSKAIELLRRIDPDLDIDMVREAGRSRSIAPLRKQLIAGLRSSGCRPSAIARYLRVSPTLVSRVAGAI